MSGRGGGGWTVDALAVQDRGQCCPVRDTGGRSWRGLCTDRALQRLPEPEFQRAFP